MRRVGLLTLPLQGNYGAMLQAVALRDAIAALGHAPVFLDRRHFRPLPKRALLALIERLPGQDLRGWRSRHLRSRAHLPFLAARLPGRSPALQDPGALARAAAGLDALVVGSDQVWRRDYIWDAHALNYFLDFAAPGQRRLAYGASFGHDRWEGSVREAAAIGALLARFAAVSVREESGQALCRRLFGRAAELVLDPVLLHGPEHYDAMAGLAPGRWEDAGEGRGGAGPGHGLLAYLLDPGPGPEALVAGLATARGAGVTRITPAERGPILSVPAFLRAFRGSAFVVTDSFHGVVLAILYRRPFVALCNRARGAERFTSLLGQLGLEARLLRDSGAADPAQLAALAHAPVDYPAVTARLGRLRAGSWAFLRRALAP